jgi:hypothetical protein
MAHFSPLSDHAAEAIVGGLIAANTYTQGNQFRNAFRSQNNSTNATFLGSATGAAVTSRAANSNLDARQVYSANGNGNTVFSFAL